MLELLEPEPALLRVAELAEKTRHRLEIVHGDVVADENRIRAQQLSQERHLHRLLLDVIEDGLVEIARADAIVAGIMEPVAAAQPHRQARLADPGHAEEGDALVVPGLEFFGAQFHVFCSRAACRWSAYCMTGTAPSRAGVAAIPGLVIHEGRRYNAGPSATGLTESP